jgi:hypothetical protein
MQARFALVSAWKVAKALPRLDAAGATPLLVRMLDNRALATDVRLAAASGLTASAGASGEAAIVRNAAFLDGARPGLSARLLEVVGRRRRFEDLMSPIRAQHWEVGTERLAANALAALDLQHPMVLDVDELAYGDHTDEVSRARGKAFLWLADHLGDHEECWDQYRNTAYVLERKLLRAHERMHFTMTADEATAFAAKVGAAIARLDADARCR